MAIYRYRVIWESRETGDSEDITNAIDLSTNEVIESQIDKFSIKLFTHDLNFEIKESDGIKIYFGEGNSTPTNLVMDGFITETKYELNDKGNVLSLSGTNKLESLLNNQRPAAYRADDTNAPDGTGWTASAIIENIIDNVNNQNSEGVDSWENIGKDISTTTKHIDYYQPYKPVFQQIEELSRNEYTGNGTYIYYLDTSNTFHWEPRPTSIEGELREGNVIEMNFTKGNLEMTNCLIIHAGDDDNGEPISSYAYNLTSIGKHGMKWKYIAMTDIAKIIINENPTWNTEQIRTVARDIAKNLGSEIVNKLGTPRWSGNIVIRGSTDYIKGKLYRIYSNTIWNDNKLLRLTEIKQRFSKRDGWTTKLSFEEDEDTALEELL